MTFEDKFGMTVREELPLNDFLNYEIDDDYNMITECVHIIPERPEGGIHIYRKVNEGYPNERIKTTVENVKVKQFKANYTGEVRNWCFQGGHGETILTFLSSLKSERSSANISINYYETNNSQMIDESDMNQETFRISYKTETDRSNEILIHNMWKYSVHKFANFK